MYAVIETGGKQIKAEAGRFIDVEKLPAKLNEKVSFDVLMIVSGKDTKIGTPKIQNATVKGHIIQNAKQNKIIVYKMRPKKRYRRKQGHRQEFSRVFIESIELDGKALAQASTPKEKSVKQKKASTNGN